MTLKDDLIAAKARRAPNAPVTRQYIESMVAFEPNTGCWIWLGTIDQHGYGQVKVRGRHKRAHRISYSLYNGPIFPSHVVCHRCDLPGCVNPEHLWLGSQRQNIADCIAKGRFPRGTASARARLNETIVRDIKRRAQTETQSSIARSLDLSREHVRDIVKGRIWRAVT